MEPTPAWGLTQGGRSKSAPLRLYLIGVTSLWRNQCRPSPCRSKVSCVETSTHPLHTPARRRHNKQTVPACSGSVGRLAESEPQESPLDGSENSTHLCSPLGSAAAAAAKLLSCLRSNNLRKPSANISSSASFPLQRSDKGFAFRFRVTPSRFTSASERRSPRTHHPPTRHFLHLALLKTIKWTKDMRGSTET